MIQHAGKVESANVGIRPNQVEAEEAVARHCLLALPQHHFWIWINHIHAESRPVLHKAARHRSHQDEILRIPRYARLLEHLHLVDHVHHAANAIFRKEDGFAIGSQSAQHMIGFRLLRNGRVEVEVTGTGRRGITHCLVFCSRAPLCPRPPPIAFPLDC